MAALAHGDTLPWYRQFWPWFLILLPASMVVASLYTVYLASRGADDLVVDDYYRDGLAINTQLEKQQRAQALGVSATLRVNGDTVEVTTAGPDLGTQLLLSFAHPLEADRDFRVTLTRVAPTSYRGTLAHAFGTRQTLT